MAHVGCAQGYDTFLILARVFLRWMLLWKPSDFVKHSEQFNREMAACVDLGMQMLQRPAWT